MWADSPTREPSEGRTYHLKRIATAIAALAALVLGGGAGISGI